MEENKNQTRPTETVSPASIPPIVVSGGISQPESNPAVDSVPPSVNKHAKIIRVLNIGCGAFVLLCALVCVYGIFVSQDLGWGFMALAAGFWGIATLITWPILVASFWYTGRPPKAASRPEDVSMAGQRRKARISLAISIAQCVLLAILALVGLLIGRVSDEFIGTILLISMFAIPVISGVEILAIIFAFQVFRTPYRKTGIISLALQAISVAAVGIWAFIDMLLSPTTY